MRKRDRYLASTRSLYRWPQQPELSQEEAWSSMWVTGCEVPEPFPTAFARSLQRALSGREQLRHALLAFQAISSLMVS